MNNYKCEIVADSKNAFGDRITTFKLTYPRIVHAELMTHRMFSRNAASSRAVPISKMIESVKNNMFIPLAVQKAHKGMQGSEYFKGEQLEQAKQLWIESAELALQQAEKMKEFGITKQLINRILEPYQYYQVLVTATEWENFFKLRCPNYVFHDENEEYSFRSKKDAIKHFPENMDVEYETGNKFLKDLNQLDWLNVNQSQAEIHIQAVAEAMWDAYNESTPKQLEAGEWHIPFGDNFDTKMLSKTCQNLKIPVLSWEDGEEIKVKIATARCARVSYTVIGENKEHNYEADIKLHDKLMSSGHWSPFEHCAKAMSERDLDNYLVIKNGLTIPVMCDNFQGFISYRSLLN